MIKTNKTEGLTLSETKSYYKATLMQKKKNNYEKGMRINNPMEQSIESRKNDITEESLQIWEKVVRYSTNSAEGIGSPYKNEIKLLFHVTYKTYSR